MVLVITTLSKVINYDFVVREKKICKILILIKLYDGILFL